ncbi:hypothetical protein [Paenibacillus sp. Root52]|uniref:hypothetical protein n=1 Tax=Paenibacillus sp. Root52 TaxID=1736552 RepID=UPI000B045D76|nr:hypothetical protein [Paenibacillus sp. Root52]
MTGSSLLNAYVINDINYNIFAIMGKYIARPIHQNPGVGQYKWILASIFVQSVVT